MPKLISVNAVTYVVVVICLVACGIIWIRSESCYERLTWHSHRSDNGSQVALSFDSFVQSLTVRIEIRTDPSNFGLRPEGVQIMSIVPSEKMCKSEDAALNRYRVLGFGFFRGDVLLGSQRL